MNHVPDELLSAFIDGEAPPSSDAAHLDECDGCQERLEQLRGVVAVVAAPVAVPAGHVREAAVAAALVETTGATPAIRRLVTRRERAGQSHATRRMSNMSAAAALVVALGVGGWLLSQVGRDSNDAGTTTALKTEQSQNDSATADVGSASNELFSTSPEGGGSSDTSAGAAYDAGAIGAFSDIAEVARKANDDLAQPPEVQAQHAFPGPDPCGHDDGQVLEWHASLTYQGEAAYARVWRSREGFRLLQVQRQTDCVLLETQALAPSTPH